MLNFTFIIAYDSFICLETFNSLVTGCCINKRNNFFTSILNFFKLRSHLLKYSTNASIDGQSIEN